MKLEFINEADTLDWVGSDYKQGMAQYNADASFRRGGVTYFIEFLDPFGSNMLAKWWDNSDNGVGYNNQGWVFVDNQFNRMTGYFSPENIDKYIKVDSDYGRKPPLPIQRILIDKVKRQLDYDALNDIKRIGESVSRKFMKESSSRHPNIPDDKNIRALRKAVDYINKFIDDEGIFLPDVLDHNSETYWQIKDYVKSDWNLDADEIISDWIEDSEVDVDVRDKQANTDPWDPRDYIFNVLKSVCGVPYERAEKMLNL